MIKNYDSNEINHNPNWPYILDHPNRILTLFRMGIFEAAHGCGGGTKRVPLPKICHTYPTIMKLGKLYLI